MMEDFMNVHKSYYLFLFAFLSIGILSALFLWSISHKGVAAESLYDFTNPSEYTSQPGILFDSGMAQLTSRGLLKTHQLIDTDPGLMLGIAHDIVVDQDNNYYVIGKTDDGINNGRYTVRKYHGSTHALIWEDILEGSAGWIDYAFKGSIDSDNNLIVIGTILDMSYDWIVVKYNPSGGVIWDVDYDGPDGFNDIPYLLAIDDNNDIIVSGFSIGNTFHRYWVTRKLSGLDGSELWIATEGPIGFSFEMPFDLALDASGHVIVTGSDENDTWRTIKYDNADGQIRWSGSFGSSFAIPLRIVVDHNDDFIIAGFDMTMSSIDWKIIKYNNETAIGPTDTITVSWEYSLDGDGQEQDYARAIVVDENNTVYIGGMVDPEADAQNQYHWKIIALDVDGDPLWDYTDPHLLTDVGNVLYEYMNHPLPNVEGNENFYFPENRPFTMLYHDDAIYIGTFKPNSDNSGNEQYILKLDTITGDAIHAVDFRTSHGNSSFGHYINAMDINSAGTLYVAGYVPDPVNNWDVDLYIAVYEEGYPINAPTLVNAEPFYHGEPLTDFSVTLGATNQGSVRFQISANNGQSWYFYDTGWQIVTDQTALAQTSLAAEIQTNIATFPSTDPGAFLFKAFFISDGMQKVELDTISLETQDTGIATWEFDIAQNYLSQDGAAVMGGKATLVSGFIEEWESTFSTAGHRIYDITQDSLGNYYLVGRNGSGHIIVGQIDSDGIFTGKTYTQDITGYGFNAIKAVDIDSNDFLYITGEADDTIFVMKLAAGAAFAPLTGDYEWLKSFTVGTGHFVDDIALNPNEDGLYIAASCLNFGSSTVCLHKIDPSTGDDIWVGGFTQYSFTTCGIEPSRNFRISVNEDDDVYVTFECGNVDLFGL